MRLRSTLSLIAVLWSGLLVGLGPIGAAAFGSDPKDAPTWHETAWPFPRDAWPSGRAFRCEAEACGTEIILAVRPKIGFCNCYAGVADDDEIDRVGDVSLVGEDYRPLALGQPVSVGALLGRSRTFLVQEAPGRSRAALAIAVAHKCDVLVVTAVAPAASPQLESIVMQQVNARGLRAWAEASVGL
jgi:hypothetical protein